MSDIECPYCDHEQEVNHEDGYGYEEDQTYQQQCSNCDRIFVYTTSIIFSHNAAKADCLNGGEHDWQPTRTWPKYLTKMQCTMCDEKRDPTEEERKQNQIPLADV